MILLAQAAAEIPEWVWKAIVGGAVALIVWFAKRELDRIYQAVRDVREELHRDVTPLRTSVAQVQALHVGMDRRLYVLEAQSELAGALRESDEATLQKWGKPSR